MRHLACCFWLAPEPKRISLDMLPGGHCHT